MELREVKEREGWKVEVVHGEKSISRCWVVDRSLRIGSARLRAGGIGGVGTLPEYRNQGLSRRVLAASLQLMKRERYDISFLHGIQDFYHKFGFITCMAEHEFCLQTRDAERARGGARIRRYRKGDLPQIVRIYNRDNATRTGSAVRNPHIWKGFKIGTWWSVPAGVRVVVDGCDRILGYVVYDDVESCCRAAEVGGQGKEVFAAILAFLAGRAVKLRREKVWANVPADHPFAIYCRDFGLRLQSLYPRNEKPMGRIIDFFSCMKGLLPELALRWGSEDRHESLYIRTDLGGGTLRWRNGGLVLDEGMGAGCARLRQEHLMQLLMGYVRPGDLAGLGRLELPVRKQELMGRLFPLQEAQLWWADRF